jgi:signal recognition particle subunit SEC65
METEGGEFHRAQERERLARTFSGVVIDGGRFFGTGREAIFVFDIRALVKDGRMVRRRVIVDELHADDILDEVKPGALVTVYGREHSRPRTNGRSSRVNIINARVEFPKQS